MIQFKCLCNHPFEVAADQAGETIQCPRCKRLNDIPSLSDLANLDEDGGFRLDAIPFAPEPGFVKNSTRAFTRSKVDDAGDEIDLRITMDDFLKAGTEDRPNDRDEIDETAPKYDPLTGELIEALQVARDPSAGVPRDAIPIAKAAINYARPDLAGTMSAAAVLARLFNVPNLFVVLVMTVISIMVHPFAVLSAAGLFLFVPVVILFFAIIIGHFCNVIEEIGPGEFDELPRPLRDLSFSDDIWHPFVRMAISLAICFGPAGVAAVNLPTASAWQTAGALGLVGFFFFPAVLLTAAASGAYNNLRPDRVFGVIRITGLAYLFPVLLVLVGAPLYVGGLGASFFGLASMFASGSIARSMTVGGTGIATMFVGLLILHYCCWLIGLIYRRHHGSFDWVMQRFVSTRRNDTMHQLELRRARNRQLARKRTAPVGAIPPP